MDDAFSKSFSIISQSGSDIAPCFKVGKQLVVYIFEKDANNNVRYIWQNIAVFLPQLRFQNNVNVI